MAEIYDKTEELALGRRKATSKTETGEIQEDVEESLRTISTAY